MGKLNKEYFDLLSIAEELYLKIYGKPQTHEEWSQKFNIKGDIIKIIQKYK